MRSWNQSLPTDFEYVSMAIEINPLAFRETMTSTFVALDWLVFVCILCC